MWNSIHFIFKKIKNVTNISTSYNKKMFDNLLRRYCIIFNAYFIATIIEF